MNRRIGWTILIVAFAGAAILDPWILGYRGSSGLIDDPRMMARYVQAVVLTMGFLQLALAEIIERAGFAALARFGAILYSFGYALFAWYPPTIWLVPIGAGLNLMALLGGSRSWHGVVVPVLATGMFLELASGLMVADPASFRPDWLGAEDSLRPRMLRLARAAAIALPILTLLAGRWRLRDGSWVDRIAGIGLPIGAATMATVLVLASVVAVPLKYLLPVPALATTAGTVATAWLASRRAGRLECLGWWLIVASMTAGLFMGIYAFDGPLPSPRGIGAYLDFPRRLTRLGHGYAIILGLLAIFVDRTAPITLWSRLLPAGIVVTLVVLGLVAADLAPVAATAIGSAMIALGLIFTLKSQPRKEPS